MKTIFCLSIVFAFFAGVPQARMRHHAHAHRHDTLTRPNIIVFLTDDQDIELGGMTPLVKTRKLIGNHGITFTNAFAATPICCPSRSSILTGRYQHNHHVVNNSITGNCNGHSWQNGPEKKSVSVYLKQANYTTYYSGKYLNAYGSEKSGGVEHVPPGWDHWIGLVGNSKYYNYTLSVDGVPEVHHSNPEKDYLTDLITNRALRFLKGYDLSSGPLFMMLSPPACHSPFTPQEKYAQNFAEFRSPRTPQFNITGQKNKHWFIRRNKPMPDDVVQYVDEVFRNRWRTLLSVDDMVESVIETLQENNMLDNTYILFMSDHGYHLGQFSLPLDKRQLYEFDIRIPFLIRGPGILEKQTIKEAVVTVDLAPTLLHLAGVEVPATMDGKSLAPLLKTGKNPVEWRSSFPVEYHGEGTFGYMRVCPKYSYTGLYSCFPDCICQDSYNNTYNCVRTINERENIVYCQFQDDENFIEFYDLESDPSQLHNLAFSDKFNEGKLTKLKTNELNVLLKQLTTCQGIECFKT